MPTWYPAKSGCWTKVHYTREAVFEVVEYKCFQILIQDSNPGVETVHSTVQALSVCWMSEWIYQGMSKSWLCPLFLGCLQAFAITVLWIKQSFPRWLPEAAVLMSSWEDFPENLDEMAPLHSPSSSSTSASNLSLFSTLYTRLFSSSNLSSRAQELCLLCVLLYLHLEQCLHEWILKTLG